MNKHRENLLKLIKMITAIQKKQIRNARDWDVEESKTGVYLADYDLLSLRELSRMFIEELNSKYLGCTQDDEIVKFIEEISLWFENIYNAIVEDERTSSDDIRKMKICGQLKNDYNKVYNEAKGTVCLEDNETNEFKCIDGFKFGKSNKSKKETYISNNQQPITINVTFTGDQEENTISIENFTKSFEKYVNSRSSM